MKILVENDKLVDILKQRETIHADIGVCMEELMKIDKEKTKLGHKMQKLKDKTKIIMDKLNPEVKEFEVISRVLLEDGKAYYEVIDQIEEYKTFLREKALEDAGAKEEDK